MKLTPTRCASTTRRLAPCPWPDSLLLRTSQKYKPLDLRPKKTRAIRRRLTTEQANAKTERMVKKARHFPLRRFAVKA